MTGRKGGVFMAFRVTGKAAHSGGNFTEGISAIEELARKVQAIHALTDLDRGITLNVGLISGGQSVNTVAPWAEGQIDLRYVGPARPRRCDGTHRGDHRAQLRAGHQGGTDDTRRVPAAGADCDREAAVRDLRAVRGGHRLQDRRRIHRRLRRFRLHRGVGTPTICAVGPVGGKAHSPDEFLRIDSLVPRAQACARAILRLEQAGL